MVTAVLVVMRGNVPGTGVATPVMERGQVYGS